MPLRVVSAGDVPTAAVTQFEAELLQRAGARWEEQPNLTMVLVQDYRKIGAVSFDGPFVLAAPFRTPTWLGPLFVAGPENPCPQCLEIAVSEAELARQVKTVGPTPGDDLWDDQTLSAANLPAVLGFVDYTFAHLRNPAPATLVTAGQQNFYHAVRRYPDCPRCGDGRELSQRQNRPPRLPTTPKDGQRAAGVSLVSSLSKYVSPVTGVVTRLAPAQESTEIVGFGARHALATVRNPRGQQQPRSRPRTGGKGRTNEAAKIAAVAEAVERYAMVHRGNEAVISASQRELGTSGLDPAELMGFSWEQYQAPTPVRTSADEDRFLLHEVPAPFDPNAVMEWVPVWPLPTGEEPKYLPAAMAYFLYQDPSGVESAKMCVADSNGAAAGATLTESTVHGLYEVIERDAVGIWWHNRLSVGGPPLADVPSDFIQQVGRELASKDIDLWLLDLTTDLDVPVYCALSAKAGTEIVLGFGCHLDSTVAAETAVAEVTQFYAAFAARPDDPFGGFGVDGRRWWAEHTLASDPYLQQSGDVAWRETVANSTFAADLTTLCGKLDRVDLTAYLLDVSRGDVPDLAVAKVFVPGACHMFPRFGHARLHNYPRSANLSSTHPQEAYNPTAIFF